MNFKKKNNNIFARKNETRETNSKLHPSRKSEKKNGTKLQTNEFINEARYKTKNL